MEGDKKTAKQDARGEANDQNKHQVSLTGVTESTDLRCIKEDLSLYSHMLDSAPDAILLRDLNGNCIYANETACKEHGYTRDEMLKLSVYQLVAPEVQERISERIKNVLTKGMVTFDSMHIRKDGTRFPVEVHLSTLKQGDERLILSIIHDASRRKIMEEELMHALKMESVVMMANGIASEFNTLITRIISNLSVLMTETQDRTRQYKLLQETDKIADNARNLVRRLVSFSISGAPVKKTSAVATLLKDTANFMLSGSNIWCNFFISDDLYPVELDQAQFVQALSNVVLNASQSMPKGGIINITARNIHLEENEISNLADGNYVRISIEDKGHGISPENLQRIFDPYFTTRQDRIGLGLSIAYSILRNHGGTITVHSELGKGSSFDMYLPVSPQKSTAEPLASKPPYSGARILVVDDEEVVRNAGKRLLGRLGYDNVDFASEGNETLNKYRESMEAGKPYDIVIIDLTIPGEPGGKQVVQKLIEMDPLANIIVSSGYFNDPIVTDFHRYGIKGVLAKPYRLEELELLLHEAHKTEVTH